MQVLLFSNKDDLNNKRLEKVIVQLIPERQIERFKSLENFEQRLRRPVEPDSIAVLFAANRRELQRMQGIRGLLPEIYVILVIPDRAKRTIKLAHLLLPRFLSQKESDFADLKIVLNKMYLNSRSPQYGLIPGV